MALPKIDLPLFELTVPSSGKVVKYRPFTVKEEKILLIAQESKDIDQIILAIKQIVNNCIDNIDADKLPMFDLEYIMLNLRSKSVNNVIKFKVKDPDTEEQIELELDIDTVKFRTKDNHTKKIQINDEYSLIMRYPTINELKALTDIKDRDAEALLNIMLACIDMLVTNDGEKIYKMQDFTQQEVKEFIEGLTSNAIKDMQTFFGTIPVLRIELPYKNRNGDNKTFVLEGLESFFI